MTIFRHNKYYFELNIPEYELPVFGYKVGELRLTEIIDNEAELLPWLKLKAYFKEHEIKICTFRGEENIQIMRLLESVGFRFVSTYNIVKCSKEEFAEIKTDSTAEICLANKEGYDKILEIERTVLDFSTFSIDPLIDRTLSSERNAIRVCSHFKKPNHRIYVSKINDQITGFIQFDVDIKNKKANTLNAGIHTAFQKMEIGKKLFSESFKTLFNEGFEIITSDYSTQNIGSKRLHLMCNFRVIGQEIHYRNFTE